MLETFPHSWAQTTLGEIRRDDSSSLDPRKFSGETFDLYSVPSFAHGRPEVVLGGAIGSSKQTVDEGTVLLCGINPRINRVWIVGKPAQERQIASTEWIPFSRVAGLDPRFLGYYLQQDSFRTHLATNAYGVGGSLMRVKEFTFAHFPFPLPPLAEQHRIVAEIEKQLTRLDASVAALRRARANLKRYRSSVLKDACEGRLVPTEASLARAEGREYEHAGRLLQRIIEERRVQWESQEKRRGTYMEPALPDTSALPALPEGWVWSTLSSIGQVRLGRQRSPKRATGPHMHPYLRAANVTWDGLDLSDVKEMDFNPKEVETYRLIRGDILLAEASGSADEVGKPAIWGGQIDDCCFQNTLIRIRASAELSPYLYEHLLYDARSGTLGRAARGVGIHHLGAQRTESWVIALPPLAEQRRIVAEVERRLSVVQQAEATVEANLRRADRLRQSVLKRAFEGKLALQDPNDEPASMLLERIRAERDAAEASETQRGAGRRGRGRASKREEQA